MALTLSRNLIVAQHMVTMRRLRWGTITPRVAFADAQGRLCFTYRTHGSYTLTLAPTKPRLWRATPLHIVVDTGDIRDAVFAGHPAGIW